MGGGGGGGFSEGMIGMAMCIVLSIPVVALDFDGEVVCLGVLGCIFLRLV